MKKIVLSAMALLAFGFANAQEEETTTTTGFSQGDVFISGSANFNSTKETGTKATDGFEIAPKVGYFITDHIAVGLGLGYGDNHVKTLLGEDLGEAIKLKTYSANVFGRYYVTPANRFSIFGELAVGYNHYESKMEENIKINGFGVNLSPGVNYFVSDHFALEASVGLLGYQNYKNEKGDGSRTAYNFGLDLAKVNLGLVYKF